MIDSCVGLDPGPVTGLCFLDYSGGQLVGRTLLQADGGSAALVARAVLGTYYSVPDREGQSVIGKRVGSVEKFVTGASAGARGAPADVTRQLVMELAEVLQLFGYQVRIRPAADVKPKWTDKRLVAARVGTEREVARSDFRHAYDAARHCLFGAREAGVIADPLLRRAAGPGEVN